MKAKLVKTCRATSRTDPAIVIERNGVRLIEAGSVIDHPDAWKLCMNGIARPEDDEALAELDKRGWGPEAFEAKFAAAEAQQRDWEQGIRSAIAPPQPIEGKQDGTGNSDA